MIYILREFIDKVDKVDKQAKNRGSQLFLDNLRFCSGYQGYQGSQLFSVDILTDNLGTMTSHRKNKTGGIDNLWYPLSGHRRSRHEQYCAHFKNAYIGELESFYGN